MQAKSKIALNTIVLYLKLLISYLQYFTNETN